MFTAKKTLGKPGCQEAGRSTLEYKACLSAQVGVTTGAQRSRREGRTKEGAGHHARQLASACSSPVNVMAQVKPAVVHLSVRVYARPPLGAQPTCQNGTTVWLCCWGSQSSRPGYEPLLSGPNQRWNWKVGIGKASVPNQGVNQGELTASNNCLGFEEPMPRSPMSNGNSESSAQNSLRLGSIAGLLGRRWLKVQAGRPVGKGAGPLLVSSLGAVLKGSNTGNNGVSSTNANANPTGPGRTQ